VHALNSWGRYAGAAPTYRTETGMVRSIQQDAMKGEPMHTEYYVIGAIALIAIYFGARLLPDFVRYMKMRSM
jgi:hypothetical protein